LATFGGRAAFGQCIQVLDPNPSAVNAHCYVEHIWNVNNAGFDLQARFSKDDGATWSDWFSLDNNFNYQLTVGAGIVRCIWYRTFLGCASSVRTEVRINPGPSRPLCPIVTLSSPNVHLEPIVPEFVLFYQSVNNPGQTRFEWGDNLSLCGFNDPGQCYGVPPLIKFSTNGTDWFVPISTVYANTCAGGIWIRGEKADMCGVMHYSDPVHLTWPVSYAINIAGPVCIQPGGSLVLGTERGPGTPAWSFQGSSGPAVLITNGPFPGAGTASGATTGTLTITGMSEYAAGTYSVTSNGAGVCNSEASLISVYVGNPTVDTHPVDASVNPGDDASFQITPTNIANVFGFHWEIELPSAPGTWTTLTDGPLAGIGTVLDSATPLLRITDVEAGANGVHARGVLENSCGETASNSALLEVAPPTECDGDVNGDGDTNVADFNIVASHFGQTVAPNTNGDLTGDGLVNVADFNILAGDFGCVN